MLEKQKPIETAITLPSSRPVYNHNPDRWGGLIDIPSFEGSDQGKRKEGNELDLLAPNDAGCTPKWWAVA